MKLEKLAAMDLKEHMSRGLTEVHLASLESKWRVIHRTVGRIDVSEITYDFLREYEGKRRATGARGQTIVREVQAIRRALKIGIRKELLPESAIPKEWPKIRSDPADRRKSGKLRQPELLRKYLAAVHQDARDEMTIAILTGLRAYELKRFEYSWVEPAPHGAPTDFVARIPAWATKTRRERFVGLTSASIAVIDRRRLSSISRQVFSQKDFKRHRARISRELGCRDTITLRDLRHSFATIAMQETGDPNAVLEALGHSDLSMTKKYLSSPVARVAGTGVAVAAVIMPPDGHKE